MTQHVWKGPATWIGNFHVNPRFPMTGVGQNLELTGGIPNSAQDVTSVVSYSAEVDLPRSIQISTTTEV